MLQNDQEPPEDGVGNNWNASELKVISLQKECINWW
jgi:hypothetical protein